MDINFDLYRIFYITAKAGSISAAARELYISQPAVSQSIKQLEDRLGGRLFFRTTRGIVLTEEGKTIFGYIGQACNLIDAAEEKFSEMQNLMSGEIKIGASDTLCKYYLLPYLGEFHRKYPDIRLHVTNRTTRETIKLLQSGEVDFGIINLPVENTKGLNINECMTIQDCFIVGEKYKSIAKAPIYLKDLSKVPVLLLEKGSSIRRFVDKYFKDNNVQIVPEIELGSIDLLVDFAKIGLGAASVIKNFIEDELKSHKLYEVKLIEKIPERKIGLVSLKDVPLSAASKKFIESLNVR